jgi:hypothetical protein
MLAAVWTGATNASDIFLLIAAIVAGLATIIIALRPGPEAALVPAAICLIALGLLAI